MSAPEKWCVLLCWNFLHASKGKASYSLISRKEYARCVSNPHEGTGAFFVDTFA